MKTNYEIANRIFPDQTTAEKLEEDWSLGDGKTVEYGKYICVAARRYDHTVRKETFYAAVYAYHGTGYHWEDTVDLKKIAWELFEDEGHALKWAFETADNNCCFTRAEIMDDAERNGWDAALCLLQLAGPEGFAGTEKDFFALEAELEKEAE